jgi:hypothetical protein
MYAKGQVVRHPKWGLGKILKVAGDKVTVFFKDEDQNPKTIATGTVALQVVDGEVDPWLANLDLQFAESGAVRQYLTHTAAVERFLQIFPQGFGQPPACLRLGAKVHCLQFVIY